MHDGAECEVCRTACGSAYVLSGPGIVSLIGHRTCLIRHALDMRGLGQRAQLN